MHLPQRPCLRDDILLREIDGDWIAYDPVYDRTSLLNPSSAFLLGLCDGAHTVAEIIDAAARVVDRSGNGDVAGLVHAALQDFAANQLLA